MEQPGPPLAGHRKGLPLDASVAPELVAQQGWRLLSGDLPTPVAVLKASAIEHNIAVMAHFCETAGVRLAPHGKTTLSAELISRQLRAGAWGITVATPHQAATVLDAGVRRILLANEVVDRGALRWLGRRLQTDQDLDVLWYVDSRAGLARAEEELEVVAAGHDTARPVRRPGLLVELGHTGGRTGLRNDAEAIDLARAVNASPVVDLVGVAGYEGTIGTSRDPATLGDVESFVSRLREVFARLRAEQLLSTERRSVVTAGGSLYFDVVARVLGSQADDQTDVVLRSGCYLTHDHGLYARGTPSTEPGWNGSAFAPALEVWGRVLSRPEPSLALADLGRRDVSHDAGLPVPLWHVPDGEGHRRSLSTATVSGLSDQHAFVDLGDQRDVAVGDLIGFGISHPCTTFDKWSQLLEVDDDYRVTGLVRTQF